MYIYNENIENKISFTLFSSFKSCAKLKCQKTVCIVVQLNC